MPDALDNPQEIDDYDDINTTAPQEKPSSWKMPAPVFRKTSGRLPKDFEKRVVGVGPVQIVSEPGDAEAYNESLPLPEPKPKSPVLKIVVLMLGLAAMVAFLIVFLSAFYFFFLRSSGSD